MKSLEQLFCEYTEAAVAAKKLSAEEISEATKLPTIEQRLSKVKAVAEARGFKESTHRIKRNAGSGYDSKAIATSEQDSLVRAGMERGLSLRESTLIVSGVDLGRGATMSESSVKELADRWKKYCPTLSETECLTLAKRNIEP